MVSERTYLLPASNHPIRLLKLVSETAILVALWHNGGTKTLSWAGALSLRDGLSALLSTTFDEALSENLLIPERSRSDSVSTPPPNLGML